MKNNDIPDLTHRVLEAEEVVDGEAAIRYNTACDYPTTADYVIVAAEIEASAIKRAGFSVDSVKILEIGSGPGNLMLELLKMGAAEVVGVDPSNVMVQYANQKFEALGVAGQLSVLQESIYHLPKPLEEAFDMVVSMNAFHQLAHPKMALEGMVRAIAPGGMGFIRDFRRDIPPERLVERANYTKPEIRGDLIASIGAAISKEEFMEMLGKIPGISFSVTDAVDPSGLSQGVRDAIGRDPVPHYLDYLVSQVVEIHKDYRQPQEMVWVE